MVQLFDPNGQEVIDQFNSIQKHRANYEGSKQQERDLDTESYENEVAPNIELEQEKANKGHDGFFQTIFEAPVDVATGLLKAGEEIGVTLGAPKNFLNLPSPPQGMESIFLIRPIFIFFWKISEIVCVDICANTRGIQIDGEIISASSIRHCELVVLIDINICFN